MRILFCIGSMDKGGAERVIANLANYMSEDKENDVGIAITIKDTSKYYLNEKIKFYTIDKKEDNNENVIIKNIIRLTSLKRIAKNFKPDVIVSFLPEPSYRVLLLKKIRLLRKISVIVSVRNDPKIEYKSKLSNMCMKMLYPSADGFVFQTEEAKEYFNKKIQKKSIIIPNPIKEEFVDREIYEGVREKTIVSVGRLEKQKNHMMLINAFSQLPDSLKDYKLIIYGEGSLRNELEELVSELELENRVLLPGQIEKVAENIEKASLFVLSSDYEGMPNALMEAMSLGLPCIATNCPCGGCKFLIQNNENGILVSINDSSEMAKAIITVIENEELNQKLRINSKKVRNLLNPQRINTNWKEFIYKIGDK